MYRNPFKKIAFFSCLIGLTLTIHDLAKASVPSKKSTDEQESAPAQEESFTRNCFAQIPQIFLTLEQATQSLRMSGAENGNFHLVDSNGDGKVDSIMPTPQDTIGGLSLERALFLLKELGGADKKYVAIDVDEDGKTDSIIAITY